MTRFSRHPVRKVAHPEDVTAFVAWFGVCLLIAGAVGLLLLFASPRHCHSPIGRLKGKTTR